MRSSGIGEDGAGQSFAGIHQTCLDVAPRRPPAAVAACRASGRTTQALEYRRAKGIATDSIEMGVLIQRMVEPVAAGVAFTVNPVSGADDEMVINSSWGVGEALVSGQVDPDEFVVRKGTASCCEPHRRKRRLAGARGCCRCCRTRSASSPRS